MKHRIYQICLLILYISLISFFTYQSLKNGEESSKASSEVSNIIAGVGEAITQRPIEVTEKFDYNVRKIFGHYLYFVVLGIVSILMYYSIKGLKLIVSTTIHFSTGFLFAFITEFVLQKLTEGRGPSMKDVGIDCLGFVTVSLIIVIVVFITNKRKSHKISNL
ncbi:MAG: VanZ family protein [Anaeroplasma sp.]